MIIYLAGGMKDGWQERAINLLAGQLDGHGLDGHEILDPRSWSDPSPAVYTERDLSAIRRADCLLVHMASTNPSGFGLSVELGYAYALGKKIVFCDEIQGDWRSPYFGMHREMATEVCHSLETAVVAAVGG
jgi:nucleoside 2-deoxyribosyltransferase